MMIKRCCSIALLLLPATVFAADEASTPPPPADGEPHVVSGMSITGNNETPKSLYIVPWKASEIGLETKLTSSLLNEDMNPVDKTVFMRELDFYKLANPQ
jgi:hypothetical protein